MKTSKLLGLVLLAVLAFCAPSFAADVKIGYANLQKALNESDAGLKAKETLKDADQRLEDEFKNKQEDLKKMKDELDKKANVWNKETKEKKENEFKAKVQEFQKAFMQKGEDLNKKKAEAESQIIEDLREVVVEIAKKKGYTYVFEASVGVLLHAPQDADITEEVIKTYNAKKKK